MDEPTGDGPAPGGATPPGRRRVRVEPAVLTLAAVVSVALLSFGIYAITKSATSDPTTAAPASSAPPSSPPAVTSTPSPSPSATPSPTPSATASVSTGPPVQSAALPIYYVAEQPNGAPALFREFHKVDYTGSRGSAAVTEMLTAPAADGDYRSLWGGARLLRYGRSGRTITLDLSSAVTSKIALQQLVYTATAAEASYHVSAVRLQVHGATRGTYTRSPQSGVEGHVWVTDPYDGAELGRKITVEGLATVFEATVAWDLRTGTTLVHKGFATATRAAPARGAWKVALTLPAGTYVFRAMERSQRDGRLLAYDTKRFVVH